MRKFVFKSNVLNVVVGSLLLIAGILEVIGIAGVDSLNYILYGLKYVVGGLVVIFSVINFLKSYKKSNGIKVNLVLIIGNVILLALGVLLIFLKSATLLSPSRVLGASFYIEGVMLILNAAIKHSNIWDTVLGIVILTLGVIIFFILQDVYIVYTLTALIIIVALIFFIIGLNALSKSSKKGNTKEKKQVKTTEEKKEEVSSE